MSAEYLLVLDVRSVDRMLDIGGSPLSGPGLHPEVARALGSQAAECPKRASYRIEVRVPESDLSRTDEVRRAVRAHFRDEYSEALTELRDINTKGRWSFLLAFAVVAVLVFASEAVLSLGQTRFVTIVSESLIIVAWVALWGPAETLLFSGFPARRKRDLALAVSEAPVVLVPAGTRP